MSNRRGSRGNRFLSLLIVLMIAATLATTAGIMVQLAGNPDELELLRIAPWPVGGILVGIGVWLIFGADARRGGSRRKGGHPI